MSTRRTPRLSAPAVPQALPAPPSRKSDPPRSVPTTSVAPAAAVGRSTENQIGRFILRMMVACLNLVFTLLFLPALILSQGGILVICGGSLVQFVLNEFTLAFQLSYDTGSTRLGRRRSYSKLTMLAFTVIATILVISYSLMPTSALAQLPAPRIAIFFALIVLGVSATIHLVLSVTTTAEAEEKETRSKLNEWNLVNKLLPGEGSIVQRAQRMCATERMSAQLNELLGACDRASLIPRLAEIAASAQTLRTTVDLSVGPQPDLAPELDSTRAQLERAQALLLGVMRALGTIDADDLVGAITRLTELVRVAGEEQKAAELAAAGNAAIAKELRSQLDRSHDDAADSRKALADARKAMGLPENGDLVGYVQAIILRSEDEHGRATDLEERLHKLRQMLESIGLTDSVVRQFSEISSVVLAALDARSWGHAKAKAGGFRKRLEAAETARQLTEQLEQLLANIRTALKLAPDGDILEALGATARLAEQREQLLANTRKALGLETDGDILEALLAKELLADEQDRLLADVRVALHLEPSGDILATLGAWDERMAQQAVVADNYAALQAKLERVGLTDDVDQILDIRAALRTGLGGRSWADFKTKAKGLTKERQQAATAGAEADRLGKLLADLRTALKLPADGDIVEFVSGLQTQLAEETTSCERLASADADRTRLLEAAGLTAELLARFPEITRALLTALDAKSWDEISKKLDALKQRVADAERVSSETTGRLEAATAGRTRVEADLTTAQQQLAALLKAIGASSAEQAIGVYEALLKAVKEIKADLKSMFDATSVAEARKTVDAAQRAIVADQATALSDAEGIIEALRRQIAEASTAPVDSSDALTMLRKICELMKVSDTSDATAAREALPVDKLFARVLEKLEEINENLLAGGDSLKALHRIGHPTWSEQQISAHVEDLGSTALAELVFYSRYALDLVNWATRALAIATGPAGLQRHSQTFETTPSPLVLSEALTTWRIVNAVGPALDIDAWIDAA